MNPRRTGDVALWALAGLVVVLRVVQARTADVWSDDVTVYWHAGRAALSGLDPWVPGFVYLPASLVAFAPLALLPEGLAADLWLVAAVLAILASAVLVAWWNHLPVAAVVLATFLAFPTESALQFGNVTAFQLLLLVASVAAARRGAWGQVALWLVVGLVLKPVLAPCLLVLVLRRRWRELCLAVAAPLAVSGLVLAVVGDAASWLATVRDGLRVAAADPASADVAALVDRSGLGAVARSAVLLLVALLVLAASVLAIACSRRPVVRLCVPLLPLLLLGPVSWAHYPLLLLPLVAAAVAEAGVPGGFALVAAAAWVLPEVLAGEVLRAVPPADVFGLFTLGLLSTVAAAAAMTVRPRRGDPRLPTT